MPVQIVPILQEFRSQYRNGENFASNSSDFTAFAIGTATELIQAKIHFRVRYWSAATAANEFEIVSNVITRQSGSFIDDGFVVGGTCLGYTSGGSPSSPDVFTTRTIVNITPQTMEVNGGTINMSSTSNFRVDGNNALTGVEYDFNIIGNSESPNFISKIDGSTIGYTRGGVSTSSVPMFPKGTSKAWITGSISTREVSNSDGGTVRVMEVLHSFRVLPFYLDGEVVNIQTNIAPALFNGQQCRYLYRAIFKGNGADPTDVKKVWNSIGNGSFVWLGQQAVGQTSLSVVNATIDQTTGAFSFEIDNPLALTIEKAVIGMSVLRDPSKWQNTSQTTFDDNFLLDTKRLEIGDTGQDSTILKNLSFTTPSSVITFAGEIDFTNSQYNALTTSDYLLLWITLDDDAATNATGSRVTLPAILELVEKSTDVPGLLEIDKTGFFVTPHPYNVDLVDTFTDFKGWGEDGIVTRFGLRMRQDQGAVEIKSVIHRLIGFNTSTGDWFTLQQVVQPLSPNIFTPDDVQQIQDYSSRGYVLANGDPFNRIWMVLQEPYDPMQPVYQLYCGMKVNWETWIQNPAIPAVFFNPSLPQNGLNRDAFSKQLNGYDVRYCIDIECESTGNVVTLYRFLSDTFEIFEFDRDGRRVPRWTGNIQTFTADGSVNTGLTIINDADTMVKATFSRNSLYPTLYNDGILRIDPFEGGQHSIEEISSIWPEALGQIMRDITVSEVGSDVILTGFIRNEKVQAGECYSLSARLWPYVATGDEWELESGDFVDAESGNYSLELEG
jgi:hypothetical protein